MQTLRNFDLAIIKFGYREANSVADFVAKNGASLPLNEEILMDYETTSLSTLLSKDLSTVFCRRTSLVCKDSVVLV